MIAEEGLKLDPFDLALKQASEVATKGILKDLLEGNACLTLFWMSLMQSIALMRVHNATTWIYDIPHTLGVSDTLPLSCLSASSAFHAA